VDFNRFPSSSTVYCEALALSDGFEVEDKGLPSLQRIQIRVKRLERAAMACHVFALIQYSKVSRPLNLKGVS
jgi:separase